MGQHYELFRTKKICFENLFFQISPCIKKISFRKLNPSLILDVTDALYSIYIPFVGVVGLAEYVCTHPILNFYRGRPRLRSRRCRVEVPSCTQPCLWIRVTRRRFHMAQDSDDPPFMVNIVVWVLVVILAIVALHCPLACRGVRWCTIWCNKSVISLLGLIMYHF